VAFSYPHGVMLLCIASCSFSLCLSLLFCGLSLFSFSRLDGETRHFLTWWGQDSRCGTNKTLTAALDWMPGRRRRGMRGVRGVRCVRACMHGARGASGSGKDLDTSPWHGGGRGVGGGRRRRGGGRPCVCCLCVRCMCIRAYRYVDVGVHVSVAVPFSSHTLLPLVMWKNTTPEKKNGHARTKKKYAP